MPHTLDTLPQHLRQYCVIQSSTRYTPRDHAAWRYVIRRAKSYFKTHALGDYLGGLQQSGLDRDSIPSIEDIDASLQRIGWGAVAVRGFIPPWAFFEFQARAILPIASDMRTVEHLHYTPAPDIVHEAAGHAPILPDTQYGDFLREFTAMAARAVYSKHDLRVYEAIRLLSDLKENPDSKPEAIAKAEANLTRTNEEDSFLSESARVARMYWWTAEYGLAGSLEHPKIYGAGLLSSVGESLSCLSPSVKKIPLSIGCTDLAYDITKPQPQLFVAEDMSHLLQVTREFAASMCAAKGGTPSLQHAIDAGALATAVCEQGVAVSGTPAAFEIDGTGALSFIKFSGLCQLSHRGQQLPGHGHEHHPQGFSSPLGRWRAKSHVAPHRMTDQDLTAMGLVVGQDATLDFFSGITVKGRVAAMLREGRDLLVISWDNCLVTRGTQVYYEPSWGRFDMIVGTELTSVFGGPADRAAFGEHELLATDSAPTRQSPFTPRELILFTRYQDIRNARAQRNAQGIEGLSLMATKELQEQNPDWLLLLELYELKDESLWGDRWQGNQAFRDVAAFLHSATPVIDPDAAQLLKHGLRLTESVGS